jgi:hypothetical protein
MDPSRRQGSQEFKRHRYNAQDQCHSENSYGDVYRGFELEQGLAQTQGATRGDFGAKVAAILGLEVVLAGTL